MENLDEKTRIQKELISAQIPTEALEVWEIKQFTMHERMFETEEKLREARKQFQKIASDVDDWASLEYLRAQRNSALMAIEGLQHVTQSAKRTPSYAITTSCVKLPPIKTCAGRATLNDHPAYGNLNSALLNKRKEPKLFDLNYAAKENKMPKLDMPDIFDLKRTTSSRLPKRNPQLSMEEFLSTCSPNHRKPTKQSKLPVSISKHTPSVDIGATPSANVNRAQGISCPDTVAGAKGLQRTEVGVVLPCLPSPPRTHSRKRTSTNLRRCHFKQSTAVSLKL